MYFFGGIHSYVRCILESLGINIILKVTLACFCAYVNSATLPLQATPWRLHGSPPSPIHEEDFGLELKV